jgi:hypothetical protein
MEHPNFFAPTAATPRGETEPDARSPTSRPTCQAAECAVMLRRDARVIQTEKGGIHMAKKAAKGAKKKAAKKK